MNSFDKNVYNFVIKFFDIFDETTNIVVKLISTLGSTIVILTVIFSLFILFKNKKYCIYTGIACLLGCIIENVLKIIIKKPRPTEFWPISIEKTYSFPSGHAFMSVVLYGMLIYFINKEVKNKYVRYIGTCIFSLIIFLVGFSRIYLGVHYATDVIGGYILALIFLIIYIKFVVERKDKDKSKKIKNKKKKK